MSADQQGTESWRQFQVYECPNCGYRSISRTKGQPCIVCLSAWPGVFEAVALTDVIAALTAAYDPQNPLSMHPADFITKKFKAAGHEGLEYA